MMSTVERRQTVKTPALEQLMGTYLHQDYDLIGSVWDNVDAFVVESPELASELPAEVDWVNTSIASEDELRAYLHSLGLQVLPPRESNGYRGWLSEIARRVEAVIA
jgi:contact-dependent growth inhibition (CDI) system CdiI-like immunity protein